MDKKKYLLNIKRKQEMSNEEFTMFLLNNYPAGQLAELVTDLLNEQPEELKPIVISQEEFEQHFKIRGITADNKIEKRGRPRKEKTEEGPAIF